MEDDKNILNKEMKRLCYLGILKECFSAYSTPVMLISRKVTKDKRVMTYFRHLNIRKARNSLAYPSSFRPLSNLSFLSHVVECAILQQFNKHCKAQDLIHDYQSAYPANYSCETALVKIICINFGISGGDSNI